MSSAESESTANAAPQVEAVDWQPLTAKQRRVLGALMEKSKTTPDAYPLSMTGLTTACNQKSNRSPMMNLTSEQVEAVVEELRELKALGVLSGSGRVDKVRHYAYQWMGLSKLEAAVMTELLLRGEQTLGELRGRAARMEPIADVSDLESILAALIGRKLVLELTPAGRGQIVSHNLYEYWEVKQLEQRFAGGGESESDEDRPTAASSPVRSLPESARSPGTAVSDNPAMAQRIITLETTVADLQTRLKQLESELGVEPS